MSSVNDFASNKFTIYYGLNNPNIEENRQFPNNRIQTTKYNIITWVPKSLIMQFKRAANIYFLIVTILTFLSFSPIDPTSMIATFIFVLACTMVKEALEDYGRYKQDQACNNRLVWKYEDGKWTYVKCWTLLPGDIIKIEKDEEFSADTLIIKTSNENGYGYIETKSLDGETNLKEKASLEAFRNINEESYYLIQGYIECDRPNENLNQWNGKVITSQQSNNENSTEDRAIYCKMNNMILKGCVLKNTDYVCGIVIYSGKNTKIMKNGKSARFKMSKVMNTMNKLLYSVFIFEIALCVVYGYLCSNWNDNNEDIYTYIFIVKDEHSSFVKFIINMFTCFVSYSQMIPISLYVVLEIIKIVQGFLVFYDNDIYDISIDKPAGCRATDLIEELGQVEFIFSDKTGTLTQNSMVLKKVYINSKVYGNIRDEDDPDTPFTINGDTRLVKKLKSTDPADLEDKQAIESFFYLLSLCHSVFPEFDKEGKLIYEGASPDEISLVKGAQQLGYEYTSKEFSEMTIKDHIHETEKKFELKIELPFDSNRKRMSVIIYNKETKEYELLSKGADSVMLNLITFQDQEKDEVNRVINVLSKEGLRVLVMCKKKLTDEYFNNWINRVNSVRNQNEELLFELYDEIEKDMIFSGCSAIEDKLQEGVSETIYTLLTCNIRIWVLTGDKQDTAEEIAKSCKLINDNLYLTYLIKDDVPTEVKINNFQIEYGIDSKMDTNLIDLDEIGRKIRKKQGRDLSIIVDGLSLEEILANEKLSLLFFHLAIAAKSVICCRVNPKQKSRVVQLVKTYGKWITLSIGDGANDVPMIMEAHIGVGIQGKEGTQAVRTADFSIGQFRFLEKLLLIHGRIGYIKISKFICYYFYKNIMLVFSDIVYAFYNGFSGQLYFADYLTTMYNAIFTSWLCLFVFSLERDVSLHIVKKFPILYSAGQKCKFFNMKVFWSYILYAIIHGFLCFYIPELSMLNASDQTGITFNHWYKSTVNFSLIIHVVSYKLLVISDFWNWVNLTAFIVSLLFYYLVVFVLCTNSLAFSLQNELAGVLMQLFGKLKFWIIMIVGPFAALIFDITLKQIWFNASPTPTEYIKQHLDDPTFKSLLVNEEDTFLQYSSNEAKNAEKKIKEILKRSREAKKKRHREIFSNSMVKGINEEVSFNNGCDGTFNNISINNINNSNIKSSDNISIRSGMIKSIANQSKDSNIIINNSLMKDDLISSNHNYTYVIDEECENEKKTKDRETNNITNKDNISNNNNESISIEKGSYYNKSNSKISYKGEGPSLVGETTNDAGSVSFNKDMQAASFRNNEGEEKDSDSENDQDEEIYSFGPDKGKPSSDSSSDEDNKERSKTKSKLKRAGLELIKVFSKEMNFKK